MRESFDPPCEISAARPDEVELYEATAAVCDAEAKVLRGKLAIAEAQADGWRVLADYAARLRRQAKAASTT